MVRYYGSVPLLDCLETAVLVRGAAGLAAGRSCYSLQDLSIFPPGEPVDITAVVARLPGQEEGEADTRHSSYPEF